MARTYVGNRKVKCCLCKEEMKYSEALHLPTGFYHRFDGLIFESHRMSFHLRCWIIWSTLVENVRANGIFESMCHSPIQLLPLIKNQSDEVKQVLIEQGFEKLVRHAGAIKTR